MLEIIFYKEQGITKAKGARTDNYGNKKYYNISSNAAIDIINESRNENNLDDLIKGTNYHGNSLSFVFGDVKIELNNYNDFIHDENFSFIFEHIKRMNYKIARKNIVGKVIITAATIGFIASSAVLIKINTPEKQVFEDVPNVVGYSTTVLSDDESTTTNFNEEITINENLFGTAPLSETLPVESTTLKQEVESTTLNNEVPTTKKQVAESTTLNNEVPTTKKQVAESTTKIENTTTKKIDDTKQITEEMITKALETVTFKQAEQSDNTTTTTKQDDSGIIYIPGDEPYLETAKKSKSSIYLSDIDVGALKDSDKALNVKKNYGDLISTYCSMYNLDSDIMCAVATQERAVHSSAIDSGGAVGLMQIQVNVWSNKNDYFVAHNYLTGEDEKIYPGRLSLGNLETNIKVACAIMRMHLDRNKQNQMIALQEYNMGEGSMQSILKAYSRATGKSLDEIRDDYSDTDWISYTQGYMGDPNYVKHVMRYYAGNQYKSMSKVR